MSANDDRINRAVLCALKKKPSSDLSDSSGSDPLEIMLRESLEIFVTRCKESEPYSRTYRNDALLMMQANAKQFALKFQNVEVSPSEARTN